MHCKTSVWHCHYNDRHVLYGLHLIHHLRHLRLHRHKVCCARGHHTCVQTGLHMLQLLLWCLNLRDRSTSHRILLFLIGIRCRIGFLFWPELEVVNNAGYVLNDSDFSWLTWGRGWSRQLADDEHIWVLEFIAEVVYHHLPRLRYAGHQGCLSFLRHLITCVA